MTQLTITGLLNWFAQLRWFELLGVSLVLNGLTVLNSVFLFRFLVSRRAVTVRIRTSSARDRRLASSTLIVNTLALLPPWLLWTRGTVELAPITSGVVIEVVYLVLFIDAAMYVVHRVFHQEPLFSWFHRWHHTEDKPPSELTLFVMHPLEAGGFGLLFLIAMLIWPVSILAVVVFFGVNLAIGTAAHVPSPSPHRFDRVFGGARLHEAHHTDPSVNFGFFTQFWDRALGTFH